jgi:hypothetical protein
MLKYGDLVRVYIYDGTYPAKIRTCVFACYGETEDEIYTYNTKKGKDHLTCHWGKGEWEPVKKTRHFTWEERHEHLSGKWVKHKSKNCEFRINAFGLTNDGIPYVDAASDDYSFKELYENWLFRDGSIVGIEE